MNWYKKANSYIGYHGSPTDFQEFSYEFMGRTGTAEGFGFYFTSNKNVANMFVDGGVLKKAILEMKRVCKPGGRVAVIDVAPLPEKQVHYDEVEKLRDPSHTKALTSDEFMEIAHLTGLKNIKTEFYKLERELENQIACSFPKEEDADKMREIFNADLDANQTGFEPKKVGNEIFIYYPNIIIVGEVR